MIETRVGDRYVLEELRAAGLALGGEQSGHIVMPEYATTGDGVLTGLHLMARMARDRPSRWPISPRWWSGCPRC